MEFRKFDYIDRVHSSQYDFIRIPTTLLNNSITDYCSRPQKIMFILQKSDGESTYNILFYEIKRDLFQSEKEFFTDELHNMH